MDGIVDAFVNVYLTVLPSFPYSTLINKLCKYKTLPPVVPPPLLPLSVHPLPYKMKFACLHPTTSDKCIYGDDFDSLSLPFFPISVVESGRRRMGGDDSSKSSKKKSVKDFLKSYKSKKSKMNSQSSDPPSEKEKKVDESKLKEQPTQPESSSDSDASKTSSSAAKIDPNQLRRKKKPKRSRKEMEDLIKDLRKEKIREPFPPPSNDLSPTVPSQTTVPVTGMEKKEEEDLPPPVIIPHSPPISPLVVASLPLKKEENLPPPSPIPRSDPNPKPDPVDTVSPVYRSPSHSPPSPSSTLPLSLLAVGVVGMALFLYKRFH